MANFDFFSSQFHFSDDGGGYIILRKEIISSYQQQIWSVYPECHKDKLKFMS